MASSAAQELGRYIADVNYGQLPADVVAKTKLCLKDSLGCLLGAYATPAAGILQRFVADIGSTGIGGAGKSHVIGSGLRTDCATAAFANATLVNTLDFDDIYKKGHPGATVIPAALAVGEMLDCSGTAFIEAVVAGYEVSTRIGIAMWHATPRKDVHGHGSWQTFGAAAAAAKLLGLDEARAGHALAIAAANAPVASVMKTVYGAVPGMAKNNFGAAAQNGVNAALLARHGGEGPLDIFEGETGFWRMTGADGCDDEVLTGGLGETYELRAVGFKPYSCCRILQSSIEAAVAVFAESGIDPCSQEAAELLVSVPPIVCDTPFSNRRPRDIWAAQFSAPFTIAMALLEVPPGPDWFQPSRFEDPEVAALTEKIALQPYKIPAGEVHPRPSHHAAAARLRLRDGRSFEADCPVASGEAANPLPESFHEEKLISLASRHIPSAGVGEVVKNIRHLQDLASVRELVGYLGTEA